LISWQNQKNQSRA